jgi:hypothetical protein
MRGSRTFTAWHFISASLIVATTLAHAGDAVAVGYNADGVWTAVTYYCSSTPRGGADYKDEKGARDAALADLRNRAGEGMATAKIIAASDRTAHVAYARGKTESGAELHAVGYGATHALAEEQAFAQLAKQGATRNRKTIYKYFSHGAHAPPALDRGRTPER